MMNQKNSISFQYLTLFHRCEIFSLLTSLFAEEHYKNSKNNSLTNASSPSSANSTQWNIWQQFQWPNNGNTISNNHHYQPEQYRWSKFFFTTVCIAVYELLLCHCFFSFQCPLISGSYPSLSIYFLFLFVKCEKFVVDFIFVLEIVRNFFNRSFFCNFRKAFLHLFC